MSRAGNAPARNVGNVRFHVAPGLRQAPPLHVMRTELNISPLRTPPSFEGVWQTHEFWDYLGGAILDGTGEGGFPGLQSLNREARRKGLGEKPKGIVGDPLQDLFRGDAAGVKHPGSSFAETADQFAALQRFRMFAAIERDALERRQAVLAIRRLLAANELLLLLLMRRDGGCSRDVPRLPSGSPIEAAIISVELATRVFGRNIPRSETIRAATRPGPSADADREWFERERGFASFAEVPIPEAVLILRHDLPRLFAWLAERDAEKP
ncbi:MAG: hypothetical protein JNK04_12525 [Myxococcales bacterium]|nr:hypothetical protein [Myxococcales bacterium]